MNTNIEVYTDGACSGNPGPGGWAYKLIAMPDDNDDVILKQTWQSGCELHTTNNQMELTAVIAALKAFTAPATFTLYSDSEYVIKGATEWLPKWIANGWRTAKKQPVKNVELWQQLHPLSSQHHITWEWVQAHTASTQRQNVHNNFVDLAAVQQRDMAKADLVANS